MQLVSDPLYSKFALILFLCVCMLGVMSKVIDTLLWIMMCIKAYCHKRWLLEQLCVGEHSSAVNLQFLHTSSDILFQSINTVFCLF